MPRFTRTGDTAPDRWDASEDFERQLRLARQSERAAAARGDQDVQPVQLPLAAAVEAAGQVLDGHAVQDEVAATEEASRRDGGSSEHADVEQPASANPEADAARAAANALRAQADALHAQAAAAAARAAAAHPAAPAAPIARPAAVRPAFVGGGGSGRGKGGKGLGKGCAKRHRKVLR